MKISGIVYESIVDGEGIRNVIFISGCKHHCKGCHNPETWDFNYGKDFTEEVQDEFIKKCKESMLIDGITLSGGDPMFSAEQLIPFIKKFKKECPNLTIWIYTGFKYENLNNMQLKLLELCDVIVDGPFDIDKRDITLKFRGSTNQRILEVKDLIFAVMD